MWFPDTYDDLGRLTVKNLPATTTEDVYYSYDLLGRTHRTARPGAHSFSNMLLRFQYCAMRRLAESVYTDAPELSECQKIPHAEALIKDTGGGMIAPGFPAHQPEEF